MSLDGGVIWTPTLLPNLPRGPPSSFTIPISLTWAWFLDTVRPGPGATPSETRRHHLPEVGVRG